MLFLVPSLVVVGVLTLLELRRGASLDSNRLLNLQVWAVRFAATLILMPLVSFSVPVHLISGLHPVLMFLAFFVVMDLGEYLFHRAQHSVPFLWRMHSLHHSDPDMNVTTTERHFWGDQFIKAVTIWPAAALIVQPTGLSFILYTVVAMWNYVCHSGLPLSFGRWSWVVNSPAYHRRHHSSLPEHYNSNYAGVLPIWDVLLGSYYQPQGHPPTGLDRKPSSLPQSLAWPLVY